MKHEIKDLIKDNLEALEHIATIAEKHDIALEVAFQDHEIDLGDNKKLVLNGKVTITAHPSTRKKHKEEEKE